MKRTFVVALLLGLGLVLAFRGHPVTADQVYPLLEAGVRDTAGMLGDMNSMRITAGPGRSLWTTVMDLNARTFAVRYFKEFERKYEFTLAPPAVARRAAGLVPAIRTAGTSPAAR